MKLTTTKEMEKELREPIKNIIKNVESINKIIKELASRDAIASYERLSKAQKTNIKLGKKRLSDYGGISFGQDTINAIEIKEAYLMGEINEEEYKAYCIKYWLREREEE